MKITREELVRALKNCPDGCGESCPYYKDNCCSDDIDADALALIEELISENKKLKSACTQVLKDSENKASCLIKPTIEILEETRDDLCSILDHIACMFGLEDELYVDLEKVEAKLSIIYKRLANPVEQQEEN